MVLAPLVRGRKGEHKEVFEGVRKAGFLRARVDGVVVDVNDPPALVRQKSHHIEAVIDRVVVREGVRNRLAESINLAVRHGDGLVLASHEEKGRGGQAAWHDELFSTQYACPDCKIGYEELEPRTFSFNSPYGACPACEGLGSRVTFDPELILPDLDLSLGRRGDRAVERRPGRGAAEAEKQPADVDGGGRLPLEHAAGESEADVAGTVAPRRRRRFPRRAGPAGKGIRHDGQRVEAAAAGGVPRRGALRGVQGGPAAARGPQRVCRRQGDPRSDGLDGHGRAAFFRRVLALARRSSRWRSRSSAKSPRGWSFSTTSGWST